MSKKPFDSKTAKKLISEYAEKINILTRENLTLKKQLEDSQTSLRLNKDILFTHFNKNKTDISSLLNDLKKENLRLSEKIAWLFSEKTETSKQLYKLQEQLEAKNAKETESIEKEKTKKFIETNKLAEKESTIIFLQKQLEKLKNSNSHNKTSKNNERVLIIGDPTKFNTEMNTELVATRSLLKKYSALLQNEKITNQKLTSRIKELENAVNLRNVNKTNNNIGIIDCVFSDNHSSDENEDDIDMEDSDDDINEEDDKTTFPDKLKNKTISGCANNNSKSTNATVPKLDLSSVLSNYKKPDNLKLNIVDKGVNKKSNRSQHDELIEKLKAQIRIFKSTILKYKEKIKKLRQENSSLKNSNRLLRNAIKNDDFDNLISNSTNNNSNTKNKINNDVSMTPNINQDSIICGNDVSKQNKSINITKDKYNLSNIDDLIEIKEVNN